jgi:hypothetical protein
MYGVKCAFTHSASDSTLSSNENENRESSNVCLDLSFVRHDYETFTELLSDVTQFLRTAFEGVEVE